MVDHTYKVVELVGSSPDGVERAIENALARASRTTRHLDWFEVKEIRGKVGEQGRVEWYQVKLGLGFRILDPEDAPQE